MQRTESSHSQHQHLIVFMLLLLATLISLYWVSRYGGYAGENDGANMTRYAENIQHHRTADLSSELSYPSGFGYPATLAMVSDVSGIPLRTLDDLMAFWLVPFIIIAFATYQLIFRNTLIGGLAAFLLLCLPDVDFYLLRLAHERFTWTFVLALVLLLILSETYRERDSIFVRLVLLFHITFFGLVLTHVFFAVTFLVAVAITAVLWFAARHFQATFMKDDQNQFDRRAIFRMVLIATVALGFIYMMINFLYNPARRYYQDISFIADRIGLLFFGAEASTAVEQGGFTTNIYNFVANAWVSTGHYFVLTTGQWIIILLGGVSWLIWMRRLFWQRRSVDFRVLLLMTFYSVLTLQLFVAVAFDVLAVSFYNNLQLRLFVFVGLLSAPFAADLMLRALQGPAWRRRLVGAFMVVFFTYAPLASILKTTLEPSFSNNWLVHTPQEIQAVLWLEDERSVDRFVRWGFWVNQREVLPLVLPYDPQNNAPVNNYTARDQQIVGYDFILMSDNVRLNAAQGNFPLPWLLRERGHNLVYSAGEVELYARRPLTVYQTGVNAELEDF